MGVAAASSPQASLGGALASASATAFGHWPWFAVFNTLQHHVPQRTDTLGKLARNAAIGFTASIVSDTISNSLRVVKTVRQTSTTPVSYPDAVRSIIASDGLLGRRGLFFRGLETRILANGVQGLLFSVLWRAIEEQLAPLLGGGGSARPPAAAAAKA